MSESAELKSLWKAYEDRCAAHMAQVTRAEAAESARDQAQAEVEALRAALEAAWRGVDSLGRYRHQDGDPFPYGAVLGIAGILRHALDQCALVSVPDTPSDGGAGASVGLAEYVYGPRGSCPILACVLPSGHGPTHADGNGNQWTYTATAAPIPPASLEEQ